MFRKKGPLLLFFFLIIVLIFVIGVRYGQNVERTNKVIDYVLKLTPTAEPKPPIDYYSYNIPLCGISFTYPSDMVNSKKSSSAATFTKDKKTPLLVDCTSKSELGDKITDINIATAEITFQKKIIVAKKTDVDQYVFSFRNPVSAKTIFVSVQRNLLTLFDGSLKFQ